MSSKGIDIIIEDPSNHPRCPHGPTLLFSKEINGRKTNFFACAACRNRKDCNFFILESVTKKYNIENWKHKENEFTKDVNHRKKFLVFYKIKKMSSSARAYCHTCMQLLQSNVTEKHRDHLITHGITNHQLKYPTEFLSSLENCKKEAQYFFTKNCIKDLIDIFKILGYR